MGVILAGGASRRMGTDKAGLLLAGRPMIEWVIDALRPALPDLVVVGRKGGLAGLASIPDEGRGRRGPLAGLVTALRHFRRPIVLVAVDQPLLRPETVRRLVATGTVHDALIPYEGGIPQVTCARYPAEWLQSATEVDRWGGSLRDLVARNEHLAVPDDEWPRWGEDGRSWFSLDTEEAILEAERRFRVDLS